MDAHAKWLTNPNAEELHDIIRKEGIKMVFTPKEGEEGTCVATEIIDIIEMIPEYKCGPFSYEFETYFGWITEEYVTFRDPESDTTRKICVRTDRLVDTNCR